MKLFYKARITVTFSCCTKSLESSYIATGNSLMLGPKIRMSVLSVHPPTEAQQQSFMLESNAIAHRFADAWETNMF